jgi:hypothetical protein
MGKRSRAEQERRVVPMNETFPLPDARWSPDTEDVEDWPFVTPLIGLGRITGRQGLHVHSGRLVEFAMIAQVSVAGHWHDVAVVDTRHEEVHFHQMSRSGLRIARKVLFPIYDSSDVDRGWDEGEKMLLGGWEEHVRRWECGR